MDVIFPEMRYRGMDTSLQKRLKVRMDMLGMNAFQTAKKAGLGESFVRDILRGKSRNPGIDKLEKLAGALDTTVEWFLSDGEQTPPPGNLPIEGLEVLGAIQAGNWVDRTIIDDSGEHEIIPVARDPRFPHAHQYALRVVGDSMDREYPEGSYVTCVDYVGSGATLKPGRIVHVERYNGALTEMTLKAVEIVDGKVILCPRSSNPRHQPIELDGDESTEIKVRGVVTGSYKRVEW